jgi:hypothetical protein
MQLRPVAAALSEYADDGSEYGQEIHPRLPRPSPDGVKSAPDFGRWQGGSAAVMWYEAGISTVLPDRRGTPAQRVGCHSGLKFIATPLMQ